jgi:hypothetical protein
VAVGLATDPLQQESIAAQPKARIFYLQAVVSRHLLETHTVGDMAGGCDGAQAGSSDCSCAVVRVTAGFAAALKDTTQNRSEGNDEEEVELHVDERFSVGLDFESVCFGIGR